MSRKLLQSMAEDCREAGDHDIAKAIDGIADDLASLCEAIFEERQALKSEDTLAYLSARIRVSMLMISYADPQRTGSKEHA